MGFQKKSAWLVLGLAAAVSPGPVVAGGWGGGYPSVKDYGSAGIPVPAPVPIPVSAADWYVRADLSFALKASGTTATTGDLAFPTKNADDMPNYFGLTFGFGRYITPSIRAEVTIDYRTQQRYSSGNGSTTGTVTTSGVVSVPSVAPAGFTVPQPFTQVSHYNVAYSEDGHIGNYAALASLYYDFKNSTSFTPYVGAGVGIAMHMLRRTFSETSTCTSMDYSAAAVPAYGVVAVTANGQACATTYSNSGDIGGTSYGLAAAAMAGFSYEISPGVLIDTGYRLLYLNGHVATTRGSVLGVSTVDIGDRIDHEIRTGIRWDID